MPPCCRQVILSRGCDGSDKAKQTTCKATARLLQLDQTVQLPRAREDMLRAREGTGRRLTTRGASMATSLAGGTLAATRRGPKIDNVFGDGIRVGDERGEHAPEVEKARRGRVGRRCGDRAGAAGEMLRESLTRQDGSGAGGTHQSTRESLDGAISKR